MGRPTVKGDGKLNHFEYPFPTPLTINIFVSSHFLKPVCFCRRGAHASVIVLPRFMMNSPGMVSPSLTPQTRDLQAWLTMSQNTNSPRQVDSMPCPVTAKR